MTRQELIARLKTQQGELGMLIAELEACDAEILASTPISELTPAQFKQLCVEAAAAAARPIAVTAAEAAQQMLASEQFDDEAEQLTGVRRSKAVVTFDEGN